MPTQRTASVLFAAMCLSAIGCGSKDDAPVFTTERGVGAIRSAQPPSPAAASRRGPRRSWDQPQGSASSGEVAPVAPEPVVTVTQAPTPPRDLDSEFRFALGDVSSCGASLAPGSRASVSVTAYLMESGRVSRAEVSGLSDEAATRCVRSRAEGISLRGPVEGAPRSVHASSTITVAAAPTPPQPITAPPFNQAGYVRPDTTLPARGWVRPSSQVAPDTTLPAQGWVRPSSQVDPDVTLPAQAPAPTSR